MSQWESAYRVSHSQQNMRWSNDNAYSWHNLGMSRRTHCPSSCSRNGFGAIYKEARRPLFPYVISIPSRQSTRHRKNAYVLPSQRIHHQRQISSHRKPNHRAWGFTRPDWVGRLSWLWGQLRCLNAIAADVEQDISGMVTELLRRFVNPVIVH